MVTVATTVPPSLVIPVPVWDSTFGHDGTVPWDDILGRAGNSWRDQNDTSTGSRLLPVP